jgi:hypothetical protein
LAAADLITPDLLSKIRIILERYGGSASPSYGAPGGYAGGGGAGGVGGGKTNFICLYQLQVF